MIVTGAVDCRVRGAYNWWQYTQRYYSLPLKTKCYTSLKNKKCSFFIKQKKKGTTVKLRILVYVIKNIQLMKYIITRR